MDEDIDLEERGMMYKDDDEMDMGMDMGEPAGFLDGPIRCLH